MTFLFSEGRLNYHIMRKQVLLTSIGRKWVALLLILGASYGSTAQPTISGPQCILPGTTYHYIITGNWNSLSTVTVCVTGGKLVSGSACSPANGIAGQVFVVWKDTSFRKVDVSGSAGNASLLVTGTTNLNGGKIQDTDRVQIYVANTTLYTFHCSDAQGGSCSPRYSYQWQRSNNALNWTDIPLAIGGSLQFSGTIMVNTFFRRVTFDARSTSIAYSDNAQLTVPFNH